MSNWLELLAPAKINLFLELQEKRTDGFHELETVMCCVNLFDRLRFRTRTDSQIVLRIEEAREHALPVHDENLIVKALRYLQQKSNCRSGLDITLVKRIPAQAGLGGASSDAATSLIAANFLWKLHWSTDQLSEIGADLGSDVPFFITGGLAVCRGRGEQVERIDNCCSYPVLICKPPVGLSTPQVFSNCQIPEQTETCTKLLDSLRTGNINGVKDNMINRLESAASGLTEWVGRIRRAFDRLPCISHQLSGSGSCYFGLFSNRKLLLNAASRLLQREPELALYCCRMKGHATHPISDSRFDMNQTSPIGME